MTISTTHIQTNRDLYKAVLNLCKQQKNNAISLQDYLSALLSLLLPLEHKENFTLKEFFNILQNAFTTQPLEFNSEWLTSYSEPYPKEINYSMLIGLLQRQIVDLYEMQAAGTLNNEERYFGINSPRGGRWYNFDVKTYLECGIFGHFGVYDVSDDSGRIMVPGSVAVLDDNGTIQTVNPEDIVSNIDTIDLITWEDFIEFLECGRCYE